MTLAALFVSTAAVAQIPTLPWNPDENGDQFVGLPDLLGLLTVYGQEFENAIVAEDGESAIMYTGDLGYLECEYSCNQLPGFWTLPSAADLLPVYSELNVGSETYTWIDKQSVDLNAWAEFPYYVGKSDPGYQYLTQTQGQAYPKKCYCTAKQLPRVEYTYCEGTSIQTCANGLVSEGWYPLGGAMKHQYNGENKIQAFWRFAQ